MTHGPLRRAARSGLPRFLVSLAISAALVAWLLVDIEPARILKALRGAYLPGVLLGTAAFLAMVVGRVLRYRVLLQKPVDYGTLGLITLVRGMLGDLLPARLGTLSYVYLVRSRAGVDLDDAFASFLLALALDMVAIAPMLLVALAAVGAGAGAASLALASTALLIAAIGATLLLAPALRLAGGWMTWLGGRFARLAAGLDGTADRVDEARKRGALLPALGLSFVIRLAKFGAHWLFLQAVLVPLGVPWGSLGFFEGFLGVAAAELSAMLPISGLAAIGTWEAAWTLAFTRLGLDTEIAVVSGFATHVLSQLHDYSLGVAALLALMWPRRQRSVG